MSADIPPSQRISDTDISNQINTFLFAGSDTTSLAIAWTLFLLSQPENTPIQSRLRDALLAIPTSSLDDDAALFAEIDKIPLLDHTCREVLRLIPPVHSSIRVAMKDDVLPISSPLLYEGKEKEGSPRQEGVKIRKGEFIHVAIEGMNLAKDVWGEDAWVFK